MTNLLSSKSELRKVLLPLPEEQILGVQGKLAENLRRSEIYRQCKQVFIDPSFLLRQARVNALLDGKELVMPAAGLKEGFYLLKPFTIPFKNLVMGVTYTGLERYGHRLDFEEISSLNVSLLIGETYGVDRLGNSLGDGLGFFDLAVALIGEMGGLVENCQVIAAVDDLTKVVDDIPSELWDNKCSGILSSDGIELLTDSSPVPGIYWDNIPMERIKRMTPLWYLFNRR